jgi:hypothetical protein
VRIVSKKTICNVVETCWGVVAESTEMLIPGNGDWAKSGIFIQKNVSNSKITDKILMYLKALFELMNPFKKLFPGFK